MFKNFITYAIDESDIRSALALLSNVKAVDRGASLSVIVPAARADLANLLEARGVECVVGPQVRDVPTRGEIEFRLLVHALAQDRFAKVAFLRPGVLINRISPLERTLELMQNRNSRFEPLGERMMICLLRPDVVLAGRVLDELEDRKLVLRAKGNHLTFPAFVKEIDQLSVKGRPASCSGRIFPWSGLEELGFLEIEGSVAISFDTDETPWYRTHDRSGLKRKLRKSGAWRQLAAYKLLEEYSLGGHFKVGSERYFQGADADRARKISLGVVGKPSLFKSLIRNECVSLVSSERTDVDGYILDLLESNEQELSEVQKTRNGKPIIGVTAGVDGSSIAPNNVSSCTILRNNSSERYAELPLYVDTSVFNLTHSAPLFKELDSIVLSMIEVEGRSRVVCGEPIYDAQSQKPRVQALLERSDNNSEAFNLQDPMRRAQVFKMARTVVIPSSIPKRDALHLELEVAASGAVPILVGPESGGQLGNSIGIVGSSQQVAARVATISGSPVLAQAEARKLARRVYGTHTPNRVWGTILGQAYAHIEYRPVSFFCTSMRPYELETILENFGRQSLPNKELIVGSHGFSISEPTLLEACERTGVSFDEVTTVQLPSTLVLGECLNEVVEHCDGDFFIRFDDDEYYASNYAQDSLAALSFSEADLVGKRAFFLYSEQLDATGLIGEDLECRYVDHVMGGTFCGRRELFENLKFEAVPAREDALFQIALVREGGQIFSADRFNFAMKRKADVSRHTWQSSIDDFFLDGRICGPGFADHLINN